MHHVGAEVGHRDKEDGAAGQGGENADLSPGQRSGHNGGQRHEGDGDPQRGVLGAQCHKDPQDGALRKDAKEQHGPAMGPQRLAQRKHSPTWPSSPGAQCRPRRGARPRCAGTIRAVSHRRAGHGPPSRSSDEWGGGQYTKPPPAVSRGLRHVQRRRCRSPFYHAAWQSARSGG